MLEKCMDKMEEITPPVSCDSRESGDLNLPEPCPICRGTGKIAISTSICSIKCNCRYCSGIGFINEVTA